MKRDSYLVVKHLGFFFWSRTFSSLGSCEFLKREKAYLPYTEDDLEQDVQTIRSVLGAE